MNQVEIVQGVISTANYDADICRQNGWCVGDVLEGTASGKGWSTTSRIRLTAIGEQNILAREVWRNGRAVNAPESDWSVGCRVWRKIN